MISVPTATVQVAKKCSFGPTLVQPNSMIPRNDASRKNAVSTSYPSSCPITLPTWVANTLQLVPNWYLITTPDTTPMPNDSAKIFTQNR